MSMHHECGPMDLPIPALDAPTVTLTTTSGHKGVIAQRRPGLGLSQATSAGATFAPRTEPATDPSPANPAGPCYSDLRASTGSLLLAELAGMRPAMSVSSTEMPMSTRALVHGRLMMLGTWWVLST